MRQATANDIPPPLELLCLTALWTLREANVEAVRQVVSEHKPLAYTTVLTLLDRLARRGTVSRRREARAFVYQPEISRDSLRRKALKEFVTRYFNGSESDLLDFLRQESRPDEPLQLATRGIDTVLL